MKSPRTLQHERGLAPSRYLGLVEEGLLAPDDRVELLQGMVVSMSPQQPLHAATVWWISGRLGPLVSGRAMVRSQLPLLAGPDSVPEPDIAVVPVREDLWQCLHPDRAILVLEVADSSIAQDRLTKSRIYAGADVPDYWIVNLKEGRVEWYCEPSPSRRIYARSGSASGKEALPPTGLGLALAADLFPPRGARLPG